MHRAQSARILTTSSSAAAASAGVTTPTRNTNATANNSIPGRNQINTTTAPTLTRAMTTLRGTTGGPNSPTTSLALAAGSSTSNFPIVSATNANTNTNTTTASAAKRSRKGDELHAFANALQSFFSVSTAVFSQFLLQKQEVFNEHVYEAAFVNIMASGEADASAGGLFDDGNTNNDDQQQQQKALAAAKASREFFDFVRDTETRDALQQGADAIALLNGGGGLDGDVSSTIAELRRQSDFWKSVAQRTHRHNTMLTESRRMLEQSAQRASQLAVQVQQLQDHLNSKEHEISDEAAKVRILATEKKGLTEQVAHHQEQAQKLNKKLEYYERAERTHKKERERDTAAITEKDKTISTLEQQLAKSAATVDLLTHSLNTERDAHQKLRAIYDAIVANRHAVHAQTDISGPNLQAELIAFEFSETRAALISEHCHSTILDLAMRVVKAEKNAAVAKKYANDALLSLEEAQRVDENKERSWAEQSKQLKVEAEAECRRANEQKKKFSELAKEAEQLQRKLREAQLELQHRDTAAKLRRGEAHLVSTQTEVSFDKVSGTKKSTQVMAMAAQTDDAWFSDLCVQANVNTMSHLWSSEEDGTNEGEGDDDGADAEGGVARDQQQQSDEQQQQQQNISNKNKNKPLNKMQVSLKNLALEHRMADSTFFSGRKAKNSIQSARQTVKHILTGGSAHAATSAAQQRKELLEAIRALSEAVTLSATHIKDLETEIDRVLTSVARVKPSRDQTTYTTTDSRGRVVIGGLYESARAVVFSPTQQQQQRRSDDRRDTATTSPDRLDFGLLHQHHHSASQTAAASQPQPQHHFNSFVSPQLLHHQHQQNSSVMRRGVFDEFQKTRAAATSSAAAGSGNNSPSTMLQQLVGRGESLENNPSSSFSMAAAGNNNSNNSNANNNSSVISRIEAVQRQAQAALDVQSPPGLRSGRQRAATVGPRSSPPRPLNSSNNNSANNSFALSPNHNSSFSSNVAAAGGNNNNNSSFGAQSTTSAQHVNAVAAAPANSTPPRQHQQHQQQRPSWNSTQRVVIRPENQLVGDRDHRSGNHLRSSREEEEAVVVDPEIYQRHLVPEVGSTSGSLFGESSRLGFPFDQFSKHHQHYHHAASPPHQHQQQQHSPAMSVAEEAALLAAREQQQLQQQRQTTNFSPSKFRFG